MSNTVDMAGQTVGRLNVLSRADNTSTGQAQWLCQCSCGNKTIVRGYALRQKKALSCGCLRIETNTKHGKTKTPTYAAWQGMKRRCYSKTAKAYKNYGGRGIRVCERWLDSFDNFLFDMGISPQGMTIERINNDGDYQPSNCRWATRANQARNRRTTKLIEYNGKKQCMKDWAKELGINYDTLKSRFLRHLPNDVAFNM